MVAFVMALMLTAQRPPSTAEASRAMFRAVRFFRTTVASHGGYLWRYSVDLKKREGEGKADADCVWVQPPGTPAVGMAYLTAYERTGQRYLLDAAREAADCLVRGQLRSGGWAAEIRFDPAARRRYAYRVDPPRPRARDRSQLDDDMTQSAIRFLVRLDSVLKGRDRRIADAASFALDALMDAQYPAGGWPQSFTGSNRNSTWPIKAASVPAQWPRLYQARPYSDCYTLNDNVMDTVIGTLLSAWRTRRDDRLLHAALRGGDFLLLAQLPDPQPGWAQQYDADMHPVWARKFEPPAISGGEGPRVMMTLISLAERTGETRFLKPIPKALAYYRRIRLPDGRLARFYELGTDRPLYFTRRYELTYDDTDLPTHYSFTSDVNLDAIERSYERVSAGLSSGRIAANPRDDGVPQADEVRAVMEALDGRGAWVEDGRLRYYGEADDTTRIIDCATFIRNLDILSRYVGSRRSYRTQPARRFPAGTDGLKLKAAPAMGRRRSIRTVVPRRPQRVTRTLATAVAGFLRP